MLSSHPSNCVFKTAKAAAAAAEKKAQEEAAVAAEKKAKAEAIQAEKDAKAKAVEEAKAKVVEKPESKVKAPSPAPKPGTLIQIFKIPFLSFFDNTFLLNQYFLSLEDQNQVFQKRRLRVPHPPPRKWRLRSQYQRKWRSPSQHRRR